MNLKKLLNRFFIAFIIVFSFMLIAGCQKNGVNTKKTQTRISGELATPEIYVTKVPSGEMTGERFLKAWQENEYEEMYGMLAASSKKLIAENDFVAEYVNFANEVALSRLEFQITNSQISPEKTVLNYRVDYFSSIIGSFSREMSMSLILENGNWYIEWLPSLMMPELTNGNFVKMDYQIPKRKNIYDVNGSPLAFQTDVTAIGLYADYVDMADDGGLLSLLGRLLGYRRDTLQWMVEHAYPGDYLPLGEVESDKESRLIDIVSKYAGVIASPYTSRFYPDRGIAPHVVGYVSAIQQDEVDEWVRSGLL